MLTDVHLCLMLLILFIVIFGPNIALVSQLGHLDMNKLIKEITVIL